MLFLGLLALIQCWFLPGFTLLSFAKSIGIKDKIIFLNDGKIVESGTHTELIAQKGMYYKMYSSQTA